MKELFIFNRLWSDQNLFFANTSDEMKKTKIKYKNINYYTRNFQKPIIYPYLDYRNHYPKFSNFEINKDLYKEGCESTDDYNFDLDCPELDIFIQNFNNQKIEEIKANKDIILKNACFIKQQYHVKGNFFLSKNVLLSNNIMLKGISFYQKIQKIHFQFIFIVIHQKCKMITKFNQIVIKKQLMNLKHLKKVIQIYVMAQFLNVQIRNAIGKLK